MLFVVLYMHVEILFGRLDYCRLIDLGKFDQELPGEWFLKCYV